MDPARINPPELFSRAHKRVASLSPSRSPTRQRITDDILTDLSPTTTLEAFTNPSGKLRASVEAATSSERAFGIRATLASKKIQEWVDELSTWAWPSEAGSVGFELPAAKRRRLSTDERASRTGRHAEIPEEEEYIGSLSAEVVACYENRIDDIHEDMDDLNVEEIKSTVLNTHFSPKSRPSSSGSSVPVPSIFSSYTRMDDFTAVVTATVLQALPYLSRLMRLMDVWTVRLLVLRKVPPLLVALDDAEVALQSGWNAIEAPGRSRHPPNDPDDEVLERTDFEIMRDVLQDKVTALGKELDYMLDTLEGKQDTLPEIWLDRMENIERDYGEWVVQGDRKVRAGEWARMAKARKAEEDQIKAEEAARDAARLREQKEQWERDEKLRLEREEASRLKRELEDAQEKLHLEQEAARRAEERRVEFEKATREAARLQAEREQREREEAQQLEQEEASRQERERIDTEEKDRLEREAELARQAEHAKRLEAERALAEEEAARQQAANGERVRLDEEAAAEAARQVEMARELEEQRLADAAQQAIERQLENEKQIRSEQEAARHAETLQKQEDERLLAEEDAARREAQRLQIETEERFELEQIAAAETARQAELARKVDEKRRLDEYEAAHRESERLRIESENQIKVEQEAARQTELAQKREEERILGERVRVEEETRFNLEQEASRQAELSRKLEEDRILVEKAAQQQAEYERVIIEQEATAEAARQAQLELEREEARLAAEAEAARISAEISILEAKRIRLEQEAAAESARQAELANKRETDRMAAEAETVRQEAEAHRVECEMQTRLENEAIAEHARQQEEERLSAEATTRKEFAKLRDEELERSRLEQEIAAENVMQEEVFLKRNKALRLEEEQGDDTESNIVRTKQMENFTDANTDADSLASSSASTTREAASDMNPASALAFGIGAALTGAWRSGSHGPAETKSNQSEISASEPINTNVSDHHALLDNVEVEPSSIPASAHNAQTVASPIIEAKSLPRSSPISRFAPFDGSDEPRVQAHNGESLTDSQPAANISVTWPLGDDNSIARPSTENPSVSVRSETPDNGSYTARVSTPSTPTTPRGPITPVALTSSPARSSDTASSSGEKGSPETPSKLARFRDTFGIVQFRLSPQSLGKAVEPQHHFSLGETPHVNGEPLKDTIKTFDQSPTGTHEQSPSSNGAINREIIDQEWIVVKPSSGHEVQRDLNLQDTTPDVSDDDNSGSKAQQRASVISGYSISDPSPEIHMAEPAEYFRPVLSPIKGSRVNSSQSDSAPKSPSDELGTVQDLPNLEGAKAHLDLFKESFEIEDDGETLASPQPKSLQPSNVTSSNDSWLKGPAIKPLKFDTKLMPQPQLARKTSMPRISSPLRIIDVPRPASAAADGPTVQTLQAGGDAPSSPLTPCCPLSPLAMATSFPDSDDESPSKGRAHPRLDAPTDHVTSISPPNPSISPRRSLLHLKASSFGEADSGSHNFLSSSNDTPEIPVFGNIDVSEASTLLSPKRSSDDQIQAQISSLLESIPARIRLTSEPDTTPAPQPDILRPKKTRRSVTPSIRPHSSLSMRAPTPSFTLAPAYGKATSRIRPHNANPQIKLYHLSRSTGEAPIKLFVRLVGENGERVMVRVGGGWADLGEYLREYASHHGRRSAVDSDRVEVQDIRSRVVSTSSIASSSAIRGNGRSSPISRPVSRPGSAFERPMSSLHIRKTRRSIGETDSGTLTFRAPSTPMPTNNPGREYETPPSTRSRSNSRQSWTEEEGGLGLAGPKAKKVAISERDQEWVETMKEKVRLVSAEKDKQEARDRDRKSLGEMDRIGGTKRLFRKK